jgi:hypothetical protein
MSCVPTHVIARCCGAPGCTIEMSTLPIGTLPSKRIANCFSAALQFLIGIVHRWLMFLNARYISSKTASSFGNSDRFFVTFRNVMFKDSIVFAVWMTRLISPGSPNIGTTLGQFCRHDRAITG